MKNVPALIVSLTSGKTEVFVTDKPTAMGASYANKNLKMLDFTASSDDFKASEEDVNLGIAVSKKAPELKAAINKALSGISTADRDQIMQPVQRIACQEVNYGAYSRLNQVCRQF